MLNKIISNFLVKNWVFTSYIKKLNWCLLFFCCLFFSISSCKKDTTATTNSPVATPTSIPTGAGDGVTFVNSGSTAIFNLYAPNKQSVYLIGDFNNWQVSEKYAMNKTADGNRWWIQVNNLDPAKEYAYQYYVDKTLRIADPYTEKILDPVNDPFISPATYPNLKPYPTGSTTGIVSVMQGSPTAYSWQYNSFTPAQTKNLVIYELLVRDFVATHNYSTLKDTLNYLVNLGINAIELLPVNEFEGNESWGYNTNFGFALDKYYGTKNDYKAFIDACHAKGIAVIQDIVLEDQFGSSPMVQLYASNTGAPTADNPWFNTTNLHPDAVGYQLNHQSAATQLYTKNVMKYWMQEYHIDGFRFDQAKGFTQVKSADETAWAAYDASRVALWKNYSTYLKTINPNFYVILEYFAGNQEQTELTNQGMLVWTNLNYNANQATMGYNTDWNIQGLFYDQYGFSQPYNLVAYFESHDEERLQFKNEQYGNSYNNYSVKNIATGLARQEMAAAFLLATPGPKMIWQFGELGYDVSINQNGRLGNKPTHWEYALDANRKHLYNAYAQMIKIKTKNPVFTTTSYQYNLGYAIKMIQLIGSDGTNVEVVGNFDVATQTSNVNFASTGVWYDNITGTSITVAALPYALTLAPGEYHVYSNVPLKK